MKKIIIIVLTLASLNGLSRLEHNYTREGKVIEKQGASVRIEDTTGNVWKCDTDEYQINDVVDLKMHDNYTPSNIKDDVIVKVIRK